MWHLGLLGFCTYPQSCIQKWFWDMTYPISHERMASYWRTFTCLATGPILLGASPSFHLKTGTDAVPLTCSFLNVTLHNVQKPNNPKVCMKDGFKKFYPRTDGENEGTIVVKLEITCRAKWQVSDTHGITQLSAGGAIPIPSPMWPVTEPTSSTQSTIFTLISGVFKVSSEL